MKFRRYALLLIAALFFSGCHSSTKNEPSQKEIPPNAAGIPNPNPTVPTDPEEKKCKSFCLLASEAPKIHQELSKRWNYEKMNTLKETERAFFAGALLQQVLKDFYTEDFENAQDLEVKNFMKIFFDHSLNLRLYKEHL